MKDKPSIGVLAFARPTFDVPFAEEKRAAMMAVLRNSGHHVVGGDALLMDGASVNAAFDAILAEQPDVLLVLQVTFTDAVMAVSVATRFSGPVAFWGPREPRLGGRLRLNAFCGINLAAHALGLRDRAFSWLVADPDQEGISQAVSELLSGARVSRFLKATPTDVAPDEAAEDLVAELAGRRIGRIGAHPDGFDTCAYDDAKLAALAGISVEALPLETLFDGARAVDADAVAMLRSVASQTVSGLDDVDADQLDRSLRLKLALDSLRADGAFDAFAIRCWPETFTEFGGAVCGPVSMQGEARVPCACEADVYGALSSLILQRVADQPVFLVDLVDMDPEDNTGVVWHCGQAPASMCDEDAQPLAAIHSNRRMPLLLEFPLKAGRVTLFRVSQARGETSVVIGGGDMLKRPKSFTGTSGVIRFDADAETVSKRLMDFAFEHHMAIVYGDHREALRKVAAALKLPVLDLTQ